MYFWLKYGEGEFWEYGQMIGLIFKWKINRLDRQLR